MIPLRFRSAEDFVALRTTLIEIPFTEKAICERFGIERIHDFPLMRQQRGLSAEIADALELMVRLYLDAKSARWEHLRSLLSASVIQLLEDFGLLVRDHDDPAICRATVLLHPYGSLYIASDNIADPHFLAEDFVFPALTPNTRDFLDTLPDEPCEHFLDLCAGTGIAALVAASGYGRCAWASDITARSAAFAEFNRRLNDLANVISLQGDLYTPFGERSFDRIVAHPPYMPTPAQAHVFSDGGEDGEMITRRIIEGLPRYLRPGGRFYSTAVLSDRREAKIEKRVRQMLGPAEAEFDLLVFEREAYTPVEYSLRSPALSDATPAEREAMLSLLAQFEIEQLVKCSLIVQRRPSERPCFTARRRKGERSGRREMEWLRRWETASTGPGHLADLLEARPLASPEVRFQLTNKLIEGQWVASDCWLESDMPFPVRAQTPFWTASLIARADGKKTARQLLQDFTTSQILPADTRAEDFVQVVHTFISAGFLGLEGFSR